MQVVLKFLGGQLTCCAVKVGAGEPRPDIQVTAHKKRDGERKDSLVIVSIGRPLPEPFHGVR